MTTRMVREQVEQGNLIDVLRACAAECSFQKDEADNVAYGRAANGESLSWMDCAEMSAKTDRWELREKHVDHCIDCIEQGVEPPPVTV